MYICTHTHIHTYTHTYMHTQIWLQSILQSDILTPLIDNQHARKLACFVLVYKKPSTDLAKMLKRPKISLAQKKEVIVALVR